VKVGVSCAVQVSARIVGPVFFNDTINCERQVQVILGQFWGLLKVKVYNCNPRSEELNENIRNEIANILAEQLQTVNQYHSESARNVYV
jgi:hypothetical protein